ncbi:MAG TPA: hemerythrin domain-containing protein [Thermoanaerobaculaceae bacterium]|nr:hemerythrin domain-containing protein [Thermoanaerobaculaceae bacterium]
MSPTETLKHEHQIVLLVLTGAEREAGSIRAGGAVHVETVEQMVDFFRTFVDRCHHGKEEKHLFPAMHEKGMPLEAGPLAVMLHEHELGRGAVRAIAEALERVKRGEAGAGPDLAEALLGYAELLRNHISKEDNVLFPMADRILPADEQGDIAVLFDKVEEEEIGAGVHEKYHELAHRLGQG